MSKSARTDYFIDQLPAKSIEVERDSSSEKGRAQTPNPPGGTFIDD